MNGPIMEQLKRCNALQQGHFALSSGLHSPQYFQCARLFDDPLVGRRLTGALASQVKRTIPGIDRVVGAALGGIIVAHELAAALGIKGCFTERVEGRMMLRRGFHIKQGERILVAEDVITTGKSAKEVASVVHEWDGVVVGLAAFVHRGGGPVGLDVPILTLLQVEVDAWMPQECPLCRNGVPVEKPGSRPTS